LQEILNHPRSGLTQADNPLENYNWDLRTVLLNLGYQNDQKDQKSSAAFVPGLESLINSNILLLNVAQAESTETRVVDPATLIRGSTPYQNLSTVVTQYIPAGGELFTYYGDDWFLERDALIFQEIPLATDLPIAEALLEDIRSSVTLIHNDSTLSQQWSHLLMHFHVVQRRRLQQILPSTIGDLQVALDSGLRAMHQQYATRTLEQLQKKGACLDRLVPKPSTVPKGGMGAFAVTSLPRGSIITTSPLLVFQNYKKSLDHQVWNRLTQTYEAKQPHHRQSLPLLVNYCWGHVESTILLCPYGTGVAYLNHATTAEQVNVLITWSNRTFFPYIDKNWLQTDPSSWKDDASTKSTRFSASFDYVAVKDIQVGEELFVDYGKDWEIAWKRFLLNEEGYEHDRGVAKRLNEQQQELRTEEEQDEQPYPAGVLLRCHEAVFQSQASPATVQDLWASDQGSATEHPCQVLEREVHPDTQQTTYSIRVLRPGTAPQWIGRAGIPRTYIRFVDRNYDTANYLHVALSSASFRHAMQLPDNMIPPAWRNMKSLDG
jgi:hypothetical protein